MNADRDSQRRRIAEAYDTIADAYATETTMAPELMAFGTAHVLTMARQLGLPVLDVGVGAGRNMVWIEAEGISVVGIDVSTAMIAHARRRVHGALLLVDQRALAFKAASFGAVWCMGTLTHIPKADVPDALAEFRRVLVTSGTLFVGVKGGQGEGWEPCRYGPVERFVAKYQPDEIIGVLRDSGFSPTACDEHTTRTGQRWITAAAQPAR